MWCQELKRSVQGKCLSPFPISLAPCSTFGKWWTHTNEVTQCTANFFFLIFGSHLAVLKVTPVLSSLLEVLRVSSFLETESGLNILKERNLTPVLSLRHGLSFIFHSVNSLPLQRDFLFCVWFFFFFCGGLHLPMLRDYSAFRDHSWWGLGKRVVSGIEPNWPCARQAPACCTTTPAPLQRHFLRSSGILCYLSLFLACLNLHFLSIYIGKFRHSSLLDWLWRNHN